MACQSAFNIGLLPFREPGSPSRVARASTAIEKGREKKSRFFRDTNSIQAATNSPTNVTLVALLVPLELGGGEEKRYGNENFTKYWKNRLPRIFFRPSGSSSTLPEKDRQRSRLSPSTELLCFDDVY